MADNTTTNVGTGGDTIATDDVGGVKFQRIKLVHGADGVNAGDVATGNPLPVLVTPPALTKGTQGAVGYSTQDLKDAGRTLVSFTATGLTVVTAEALVSLTPYRDLVAGAAATSHAVTSGKRLRITAVALTVRATSTVAVHGLIRLRLLAGTVLVASPVHLTVGGATSNITPAVIGHALTTHVSIPDGLELSGTMQLGVTQLFSAATATIDLQILGFEY